MERRVALSSIPLFGLFARKVTGLRTAARSCQNGYANLLTSWVSGVRGRTRSALFGIPRAHAVVMTQRSPQLLNALDLLTDQHAEVDELFEQLEANGGDRQAAFAELADKLAAHATIEEKLFYPRVMSEDTSELLHEAVEEHLAIKRVLADILTMELDADEFTAKLAVLKEQVSHHAHEEEEAELFPILRESMDDEELAGLGNELLVMFEQLIASEPRFQVPQETAEAAPLPA